MPVAYQFEGRGVVVTAAKQPTEVAHGSTHYHALFGIGIILFLGALLMTVGNGMIDGAKQGIEENMINSLTGHLLVISDAQIAAIADYLAAEARP